MKLPDEYADELEYIDITHEMATLGAEIRTVYITSLSNKFWHFLNELIGRAPCIAPSPQSDYDLWEGYRNIVYSFLKKVDWWAVTQRNAQQGVLTKFLTKWNTQNTKRQSALIIVGSFQQKAILILQNQFVKLSAESLKKDGRLFVGFADWNHIAFRFIAITIVPVSFADII